MGVGKDPTADPDVTRRVVGLTDPPLALKVTVLFATHLAQYVVERVTIVVENTCVPNDAESVNHPTNVNPFLVGVGRLPTWLPVITVRVVGLTEPHSH